MVDARDLGKQPDGVIAGVVGVAAKYGDEIAFSFVGEAVVMQGVEKGL